MENLDSTTQIGGVRESMTGRNAELAQQLNRSLHELSQPLTVLLCELDAAAHLDSAEELKLMSVRAMAECRRLQETVQTMQIEVQQAMRNDAPHRMIWT